VRGLGFGGPLELETQGDLIQHAVDESSGFPGAELAGDLHRLVDGDLDR
jgi:hypothetical protein